jgi:hypothetical protein
MVNHHAYNRTLNRFIRLKTAYEAYIKNTISTKPRAIPVVITGIFASILWGITQYHAPCPPNCRSIAAEFAKPWVDAQPLTPSKEMAIPASESSQSQDEHAHEAHTWSGAFVTTTFDWVATLPQKVLQYGQSLMTYFEQRLPLRTNAPLDTMTSTATAIPDLAMVDVTATRISSVDTTTTMQTTPIVTAIEPLVQTIRGTKTLQLTAPAVCWGIQIDGVGFLGNPVITTFVQMPRRVTIVDGGCATNADMAQQLAILQRKSPNDHWQRVPADASLAANAPAQQWDLRDAWHKPKAGDVCWGEGIGSKNDRYGVQGHAVIINFANDDIERYVYYGTCERNGRTFAQIERTLQTNEPQRNWIAVPDITTIRNQTPPVPRQWYVQTSDSTTVDANSICWGTRINGYGIVGNPVIVGINQNNTAVNIESGACITAYRDITAMTTQLKSEHPYLNWQVVNDINALGQASLASNIFYKEQQVTLTPGDVCFVLTIRDMRTPVQSRYTYGKDQHGIVFRVDTAADVFISYGICERNARSYDQLLNSMRTYESNKQWVGAGTFSTIANLPDVPHVWQSGEATNTYNAKAGSICWGMDVGVLHNASNRILVRFNQAWNAIPVRIGQCQYDQRSWPDTVAWITKEQLPDDPNNPNDDWWVVDDYAAYGQ